MTPSGAKIKKLSPYEEACRHLVGGVNSPVRAFKAVGGEPFFVARAKGSKIRDTRGKEYIDFVGSWGPQILGHAHPALVKAVKSAAERGTSFGAPTLEEVELAKLVKKAFPSIEKVRFVSSGTEAVMSAVRVARGFTGRKMILKFSGCYHGHSDALLVKAGSGAMTFGVPDSNGVPQEFTELTLNIPYNNETELEKCFREHGAELACVLVEPVAGNMGLVKPDLAWLKRLRQFCSESGALLIFDEVITGFRVAPGGAQEVFGVKPDITCLGKILGGGLPMGAFGARKEIMDCLAPLGDVYQAGTLSGNPLAANCGLTMLKLLSDRKIYKDLEKRTEKFLAPVRQLIRDREYPVQLNAFGSMFTFFFTQNPVHDLDSAKESDTRLYAKFFHELLKAGIFFPPAQFEACFVSAAHSEIDLARARKAVEGALSAVFKN